MDCINPSNFISKVGS